MFEGKDGHQFGRRFIGANDFAIAMPLEKLRGFAGDYAAE
jgi:hypothetical protein